MCRCNQITKNRSFLQLKAKKYYTNTCNVNTLPFFIKNVNRRKRGMNVSVTSLSKLISTRKEELARLLEWRGTNFPVVERQNDLRISFIELELEDLEELNNQPQLNENQQIVLEYLKGMCPAKLGVSAMVTAYCLVDDNINDNWQEYSDEIPEHIEALQELSVAEENQVLEVFANWALEQGEE